MANHIGDLLRSGATAFSATETNIASLKINGTDRDGYWAVASWNGVTGGTNDVSTMHAVVSPSAGTYQITLGGQTTTALNWNDSTTTIVNAILALKNCVINNIYYPTMRADAVTVPTFAATGYAAGDVALTFGGPLAAQSITVTLVTTNLTVTTPTIVHTTTGVGPTCQITFQDGDDNTNWRTPAQFGSMYCGPGLNQSRPVRLETPRKWLSYTATFGGSGTFKNLQIAITNDLEGIG